MIIIKLLQTAATVNGPTGVFVTDHAEEVLKCELVSVTGPFPVGSERCVIH